MDDIKRISCRSELKGSVSNRLFIEPREIEIFLHVPTPTIYFLALVRYITSNNIEVTASKHLPFAQSVLN